MRSVEAEEGEGCGRGDMHVFEHDVAIDGQLVALEGGVVGRENERVHRVANADITVGHVVDVAAATGIALDAQTVVGTVDGQVVDQQMIDAASRARADRHTVAGVEVAVQDRHVFDAVAGRGLEANVVVAGADAGVGDGDVARGAGIDAVGVARGLGRADLHAPSGEAVGHAHGDMKIG